MTHTEFEEDCLNYLLMCLDCIETTIEEAIEKPLLVVNSLINRGLLSPENKLGHFGIYHYQQALNYYKSLYLEA